MLSVGTITQLKEVWYKALPLIVSGLAYCVTQLTPYASNGGYAALAVLVIDELIYTLKSQEITTTPSTPAPATPAPATPVPTNITSTTTTAPAVTYQYAGHTITVELNAPMGTKAVVGGVNVVVGQAITAPLVTSEDTKVPAGAIYIGEGEFELNGNYYD